MKLSTASRNNIEAVAQIGFLIVMAIWMVYTAQPLPSVSVELAYLAEVRPSNPWVVFSPTTGELAFSAAKEEIGILGTDDFTIQERIKAQPYFFEFARDGRLLLSSSALEIRLWDISSGKSETVRPPSNGIRWPTISPDGKTMAGIARHEIICWDIQSVKRIAGFLYDDRNRLSAIRFSPCGRLFAYLNWIGGDDPIPSIRIRNLAQQELLYDLENAAGRFSFSPDGETIAASYGYESVRFWDVKTGKLLPHKIKWPNGCCPTVVDYSPDGRLVVSGGSYQRRNNLIQRFFGEASSRAIGGMIKISDANSGAEFCTKKVSSTGAVIAVSFSPDGKYLAVTTDGPTPKVMVWRVDLSLANLHDR